jgi:hypothetical protein
MSTKKKDNKKKELNKNEAVALIKARTIGRVVFLTALSEMLATAVTDSSYEKEYKQEVKKRGNMFIAELDKKLNLMLANHEEAKQVHNVIDIVRLNMKNAAFAVETEMVEVIMEEYLEEDAEREKNAKTLAQK